MNCPKCHYQMSDTDLDCPRCEKYGIADVSLAEVTAARVCARCGARLGVGETICYLCSAGASGYDAGDASHGFTPPWKDAEIQTGSGAALGEIGDEVNMNGVYFMWALTALYFLLYGARVVGLASVCGFSSFVLSFFLIANPSPRVKTHGWIRLGISGVVGLVAFMNVVSRQ